MSKAGTDLTLEYVAVTGTVLTIVYVWFRLHLYQHRYRRRQAESELLDDTDE